MSHDIEADYKEEYDDKDRQCRVCQSYQDGFCKEMDQVVPPVAHCDFFSSID